MEADRSPRVLHRDCITSIIVGFPHVEWNDLASARVDSIPFSALTAGYMYGLPKHTPFFPSWKRKITGCVKWALLQYFHYNIINL